MTVIERLLNELGRDGGVVDTLDPDNRARVLNEVRTGLRVVNEAVWTIYVAGSEPDDPAGAKEVFGTLEGLPGLLDRALRAWRS
jgi:hypothetical protein